VSRFKPIRKVTKFVFLTVPAGLISWNLNRRLFLWLRSLWVRSVNPACAECNLGVMVREGGSGAARTADTAPPLPWICNRCGYAVFGHEAPGALRRAVGRRRQDRAQAAFNLMQPSERSHIARKHCLAARLLYATAALTFVNGIHMLARGASTVVALNWAAFSVMCAVFGLIRVYRAWQLLTGHIFEAGAFWYWFAHEKWLR
jgi:hypothetical protein